MRATAAAVLTAIAIGAFFTDAALAAECRDDPAVVAQCFTVHGRLSVWANLHTQLWPVGTKRLLRVDYLPGSPQWGKGRPFMPENVRSMLDLDSDLYGDFEVCPFTVDVPGELSFICIQSASHLVRRDQSLRR